MSAIVGCTFEPAAQVDAPAEQPDQGEVDGVVVEPIIGGAQTTDYPEATFLNMISASGAGFACSATLIAPRVVLTAGHCVDGMARFDAYVNGVHATSTHGETYDWHENGALTVNPNHHDIGLVVLDQAVTLSAYPLLETAAISDNTQVIDVGRIHNGLLTNTMYKAPVSVRSASSVGYPFDYVGNDVIEHGDSGGPAYLPGTHTIVAVNSGAGGGIEVLARVDLLRAWILGRIAANGGNGASAASDAGAPPAVDSGAASKPDAGGAKPSSPAQPAADAGAPTPPSCTYESEPNNTFAMANPLAASECGLLATSTDIDWFTFSAAPGKTELALSAAGDATMTIGIVSRSGQGTSCTPALVGQHSVQITVRGAANIPLCLSVASASHRPQPYRLSEAR